MDWNNLLKQKSILVADGAWGTEFAKQGLKAGDVPELWNIEHPDRVLAVAKSYVEAGSDIILTNTFGANRLKLAKSGLSDRLIELNRAGVALSRQAAGSRCLVFASIGSTGEFIEPLGDKTAEEITACFAAQVKECAAAGADGIVVETMTDLTEALAALAGARRVCNLPVAVCLTYDRGQAGFATIMGVKPEAAAKELDQHGADIIGSNCGAGIDNMIEVTKLLRSATNRPLWIKANAGLPQLVNGATVFCETPEQTASKVGQLIEAGANIIGGCCGTTPEHIRHMVQAIEKTRTSK
jgi:5-methyltetrahydrofolate--homocysteine methyltransferase